MSIETKTCYELVESQLIDIPPVQRGLVWSPQQVGTLWDSILEDMPIGTLMAYKEGKEGVEKWNLIDGQQRYNAIRTGICPKSDDSFRIWVARENGSLTFMVCSESHPWGYKKDYSVFSYKERDEFNAVLKKGDNSKDDDFFAIASLRQAYPMMKSDKNKVGIFIPLCYVLKGVYPDWEKSELFRRPDGILDILGSDIDIKKEFESIKEVINTKKISRYSVPVYLIEKNKSFNAERIETLFKRINTQGTPLSREDARYSSLCVLMGKEIKERINSLAVGFMPPSRLAEWALRIFLLLHESDRRDVLTGVSDADFRQIISSAMKDEFVAFCKDVDKLEAHIKTIRKIYNNDKKSVPPLVYLENRNDHWITTIAWMSTQYGGIFKEQSEWYPLLGMLPEVMCSKQGNVHCFIREFWECVRSKEIDKKRIKSLGELMAVGCAYAALTENSFVHMFPSSEKGIEGSAKIDIINQWWNWTSLGGYESRPYIPFTHNRFILYYAQRDYLAHILKNIKPEMREMWGRENNKPFDIDHIIPKSLWPNETMMDQLANKQILFFRHNREKGARHIGSVDGFANGSLKDIFVYPVDSFYHELKPVENGEYSVYKTMTWERWKHLIKKVYSDLKISDLIRLINEIPNNVSGLPQVLQVCVNRFCMMRDLKASQPSLQWGCLTYRGLSRNNIIGMIKMGDVSDFAHSLVRSLTLGDESTIDEVPVLKCITIGLSDEVAVGVRRGFGVSPYVDQEMYRKWCDLERKTEKCAELWTERKICKDISKVRKNSGIIQNYLNSKIEIDKIQV